MSQPAHFTLYVAGDLYGLMQLSSDLPDVGYYRLLRLHVNTTQPSNLSTSAIVEPINSFFALNVGGLHACD